MKEIEAETPDNIDLEADMPPAAGTAPPSRRSATVDPLDFDLQGELDQSSRIDRRIAHGVYRISHNKREIGEELWGVFGLKNGGYRLMTEIDLKWPVPNQQHARFDLTKDWHGDALWIQIDAEGARRIATYFVEGDIVDVSVFEQPLRYPDNGHASRLPREQVDRLREHIPPRQVLSTQIALTPSTFLDFGSTLFNFAHLKRIALQAGQSVPMTAIIASQPDLTPLAIRQTYAFTRVEQVTNSLDGYGAARRYVITEEGDDAPVSTLWTDERGITLRQEVAMRGELHGCELISYTWV